jgi:hypothetical protein
MFSDAVRTSIQLTSPNPPPPPLPPKRLLSPHLADEFGNPLSSDKRRKWCDEPENLEGLYFNTEHVYTMHLYQHVSQT